VSVGQVARLIDGLSAVCTVVNEREKHFALYKNSY